MRIETDQEQRELLEVEQARTQLEALGFWSIDSRADETEIVTIPEVNRTRVGLVREEGMFPILDRNGLWREAGVASKFLGEYEDNPDLIRQMIQHSLNKRVGHSIRFTGHYAGVTSVAEPRGVWFEPLRVFDIAIEELGGKVEGMKLDRKGLSMRFVGDYSKERPRDAGDVLHAGLVIKMNGNVQIGPYCYQMVCSNGLMRMYERLQIADSLDMVATEIRSACQAQHAASRELTDNMITLDEQPFTGNREQTLVRLGQTTGLPSRFIAKALEKLPELPEDATMFDMTALVTRMARDLKRSEKIQMRLGSMVRHLSTEHARCSHCGTELPEN